MSYDTLFQALSMLLTFNAIAAILVGTLYGIIVGAIPGLGSVLGITVILPFTFVLDQSVSLALLLGTYCGSVYGGCIPAILINTPGTPQSAATVLDGYPMARKGQPAQALGWATFSSAAGGIIACIILAVAAPLLAHFGLRFGPIEYFALGIFALTCIVSVARESMIKGVFGTAFGLFIAMIGQDPISGITRYDFGIFDLSAGLALIPVLVGLFALSEVLWRVAGPKVMEEPIREKIRFAMPPMGEIAARWKVILKSSLIGTWIGSLPGIGATAASLVSYAEAKRSAPASEKFGTGIPEGIIASEAANNAVTAGALVPTLALGVPGDPITAVMLGAMTIQNVIPGPSLFVDQPGLVLYIFIALFTVNIVMFFMGATLGPLFSRVLRIPEPLLLACTVALIVVGTYSVNENPFDLIVLLVAGMVGFLFRWIEIPLAPVVIGFVLSPMIESSLRRGLILTNDSFWGFFASPIALGLFVLTALFLLWPAARAILDARRTTPTEIAEESDMTELRNERTGPLSDLRVLDISTIIAAPLAATLMADYGADVVKVEMPGQGDGLRNFPPFKEGESLWWKVTNRGKRFVELDLRTPEGAGVFKRMVKDFDVVIENFRPGTLERWGLGPDVLHGLNPSLVLVRVTGFGQDGPYAKRPGFARLFEAMSGLAHLTGDADGPPQHPAYPMGDAIGGLFGALSVVTALHSVHADPERRGQVVDLSLTEAVFRLLDYQTIAYDQLGQVFKRTGNWNQYSAPSDVYPTRDEKYVSLSGSTNGTFAANLRAIGRTDLLENPRFASNSLRVENAAEIDAIFRDWFAAHELDDILEAFTREGGTLAPIYSADMIFRDPQFQARDAIVDVPDDSLGVVRMQTVVPRFSRTPCCVRHSARSLGHDSEEALQPYRAELESGGVARKAV